MNDQQFIAQLRRSIEAAIDAAIDAPRRQAEVAPPPLGAAPVRDAPFDTEPFDTGPLGSGRRRRSGRRSARRAAATVVAAVVAIWAVVTFGPATAGADLTVLHADGTVTITLEDVATRPEEIVRAAGDAGIDLTIIEEPVGPSKVGRFLSAESDELPPSIVPTDMVGGAFLGFEIPDDFAAPITIRRGRSAAPGETWATTSDALAPGEVLECEDFHGVTAAELADRTKARHLDIRWFFVGSSGQAQSATPEPHPTWRVVEILADGPDSLVVTATEDGAWPYPPGLPEPSLGGSC